MSWKMMNSLEFIKNTPIGSNRCAISSILLSTTGAKLPLSAAAEMLDFVGIQRTICWKLSRTCVSVVQVIHHSASVDLYYIAFLSSAWFQSDMKLQHRPKWLPTVNFNPLVQGIGDPLGKATLCTGKFGDECPSAFQEKFIKFNLGRSKRYSGQNRPSHFNTVQKNEKDTKKLRAQHDQTAVVLKQFTDEKSHGCLRVFPTNWTVLGAPG